MIRLGLCCKFLKEPIKYRTTTVSHLKKIMSRDEDPKILLNDIVKNNINSLMLSIEYCIAHKIGSFRIGSDFLPVVTHPDVKYEIIDLPEGASLLESLSNCKIKAQENNIRLTFHPSQFVLINSPREDVIEKSIQDLEYHAKLSELLGADVINIHFGGGYGDKPSAIKRFIDNYIKLPERITSKLTLENDDKIYTPKEILPVCKELGIPLVYDVHHHRCNPDDLSVEEATNEALLTWDREPLFHVSSPIDGWEGPRPIRHHDYINIKDFPKCWENLDLITVEIEAKAKECAIEKLQTELLEKSFILFPNNT